MDGVAAHLFVAGQDPLLIDDAGRFRIPDRLGRAQVCSSLEKGRILLLQGSQRVGFALNGDVVLGAAQPQEELDL